MFLLVVLLFVAVVVVVVVVVIVVVFVVSVLVLLDLLQHLAPRLFPLRLFPEDCSHLRLKRTENK